MVKLNHYSNKDNEKKDEVIEMLKKYNKEFEEFDMSLADLSRKYIFEEDVSDEEALIGLYNNGFKYLITVEKEGDLIGFRFVNKPSDDDSIKEYAPKHYPSICLTLAIVEENYRGKGIWSKMMDYFKENILPKFEYNKAHFLTSSNNKSMQKAGEKRGFEKVATVEDDRGEGIDTLFYVKEYS